MSTIHRHGTTTATPQEYVDGLTDFGPGRSELFGNSADEYLKVHDRGPDWADVTDGSGGVLESLHYDGADGTKGSGAVRERRHYDWSDPDRVVMKTTDSNVWGGASGHTYTFPRNTDGTTDLDAVVIREGKNLQERLVAILLGTGGKRVLGKALANTVKAIEARSAAT